MLKSFGFMMAGQKNRKKMKPLAIRAVRQEGKRREGRRGEGRLSRGRGRVEEGQAHLMAVDGTTLLSGKRFMAHSRNARKSRRRASGHASADSKILLVSAVTWCSSVFAFSLRPPRFGSSCSVSVEGK